MRARTPGLGELAGKVLSIEFEQDGIEETLGLAAGGTSCNDDIPSFDMGCPDGTILMHV